jgi:hypothetical protein
LGRSQLKASWGKKLAGLHLNQQKLGKVAGSAEIINRRIVVQTGQGIKARPYWKK